MKKKNVIHVVTYVLDGGLEKLVYLIISNLQQANFNHYVIILTPYRDSYLLKLLFSLNVTVINFDFDNRILNLKSIYKNIVQTVKLARFYRKVKADVLHSHDFFPAFVSRISYLICVICMFYKVKRIYINLNTILYWLKPAHNKINRLLSLVTDKIICGSTAAMEYSIEHDKINVKKYEVIYNGVDSKDFIIDDSLRLNYAAEFGIEVDDIVIGNAGVFSIRKGQKYLLLAIADLVKSYPNLKLLIFGSEREHEIEIKTELYDIVAKYNMFDNVRILNSRKDLNKIYNIFDIFVMPSITEGMSLSALEAMLMERICLFSDIKPFMELVQDGRNGFLFKSENIDDLKYKLEYIIQNYRTLNNVKKAARQTVLLKYNSELMVEMYKKLYLV